MEGGGIRTKDLGIEDLGIKSSRRAFISRKTPEDPRGLYDVQEDFSLIATNDIYNLIRPIFIPPNCLRFPLSARIREYTIFFVVTRIRARVIFLLLFECYAPFRLKSSRFYYFWLLYMTASLLRNIKTSSLLKLGMKVVHFGHHHSRASL